MQPDKYAIYCVAIMEGAEARAVAVIVAGENRYVRIIRTDIHYALLPQDQIIKYAELKAAESARDAIFTELDMNQFAFSVFLNSQKDSYKHIPQPSFFDAALRIARYRPAVSDSDFPII